MDTQMPHTGGMAEEEGARGGGHATGSLEGTPVLE